MLLVPLRCAPGFPVIVILTIASFAGCASTTTIDSRPTGARLLLDGTPVGNTPYTHSDTRIVGSTTQVRIESPGYQPYVGVLARNEELDALALVGGIFLLVPFLWIMRYRPTHVFELQPMAPAGYPAAAAPYGYPPAAPEAYPPPAQGYPPPPAQGYPPPPAQGYPPPPR